MTKKGKGLYPLQTEYSLEEIEAALLSLAEKGLVVDTGCRKWSERTGRYQIVWAAAGRGEKLH
jgi:hypothetical protein